MKGGKEKGKDAVPLFLRFLFKLIRDNQKLCIKYRMEAKAEPGAQNEVRSLEARRDSKWKHMREQQDKITMSVVRPSNDLK